MSRKILNLLVLAIFVVVPVLCVGGLLQHACECANETACSHESNCDGDPCSRYTGR